MADKEDSLDKYVRKIVYWRSPLPARSKRITTTLRIEKAFLLLPDPVRLLFLSGARSLHIEIVEDTPLPLGMRIAVQGPVHGRDYMITLHHEELGWPEDYFLGSLLRELGHVVAERPPEDEWPAPRAERALYKERLESRADAMVWRWGLRHYSMVHLSTAYPRHRLEAIISEITRVLLEEADAF